jgi:hypothetical protein
MVKIKVRIGLFWYYFNLSNKLFPFQGLRDNGECFSIAIVPYMIETLRLKFPKFAFKTEPA